MKLSDLDIDEDPTTAFDRSLLGMLPGLSVPPHPGRPPAPIALPTSVHKRVASSDAEWFASLPAESRDVLLASMVPARPWPEAERISGAVCTPIE